MVDEKGITSSLLLKRWTANVNQTPRPIFVLERTSVVMHNHKASPGQFLQLWVAENDPTTLRLSVVAPNQGGESTATAIAAAAGALPPAPLRTPPKSSHRRRNRSTRKRDDAEEEGADISTASPFGGRSAASSALGYFTPSRGTSPAAAEAFPDWIRITCGDCEGDLHVPTLLVTPLDKRNRAVPGGAVSIAQFECMGNSKNTAHHSPTTTTPARHATVENAVMVEGTCMSLHRWLATRGLSSWGGSFSLDSGSAIESEAEAGEVLLSMVVSGGGKTTAAAAAAGATALPFSSSSPLPQKKNVHKQQKTSKAPSSSPIAAVTKKPTPAPLSPSAAAALHSQLAQEALSKNGVAASDVGKEALKRLEQLTSQSRHAKLAQLLETLHHQHLYNSGMDGYPMAAAARSNASLMPYPYYPSPATTMSQ